MPVDESDVVLRARGLIKDFGDLRAVDGVDLTIGWGEIYGFLGPNGAGKSTTVRMLIGLLQPTAGSVEILGYDVFEDPFLVKDRIGYMPQHFSLYNDLTVMENLRFYSGLYEMTDKSIGERIDEVLEMVELNNFREHITGNLSGGMKQKLALACALVHSPEFLILDEPTAGIDPLTRRRLWEYLYEIGSEGIAIMVTTHYLDEAEHCNRIGVIYRGKIVAEGTPSWIKEVCFTGNVLSIETDDWRRAFYTLKQLYPEGDIMLFGTDVHLVVDDIKEGEKKVREVMKEEGIRVNNIYPASPTLEDVFIQLQKDMEE